MLFHCSYDSPVGGMTLLSDRRALTGAWFDGQKYFSANFPSLGENEPDAPPLRAASLWLDDYFSGERPPVDRLSLAPLGTPFRLAVWEILLEIPYGRTVTYGEIARALSGKFMRRISARAVGGAVAHNPLSVVIPCHRVVGCCGSLSGYAGGLERKIALLRLEGVLP